jgi:hypothetical protein
MKTKWTFAGWMIGTLVLIAPAAWAADEHEGGGHGGGPGTAPIAQPAPTIHVTTPAERGRGGGESERLGTYPYWYRFHHHYGYNYPGRPGTGEPRVFFPPSDNRRRDDRYSGPYVSSPGYSVYMSGPLGIVGYWRDGTYYGYVPYDYRSIYGPGYVVPSNVYTGGDAYNEYIVLNTPTAPSAVPGVPPEAGVPGQPATGGEFESSLSPMLGGPDHVGLAFALGEISLKSGQTAEAVTAFRLALRADPGAPGVRLALALALAAEGDYVGSAQMVRLGVGGVADPSGLAVDGAEVFGSAEALDGIIAGVQAAAAKGEADGREAQLVLGFVCFATGRLPAARDALWAAYEGAGGDVAAGRLLLAAEKRLGKEAQAPKEAAGEGAKKE